MWQFSKAKLEKILTASSLLVPKTKPTFRSIKADDTQLSLIWDKPDTLSYLLALSQLVDQWGQRDRPLSVKDKIIRSDAAWAEWLYELTITSGSETIKIGNISTLSYYRDGLVPDTNYSLSLSAYNEIAKGENDSATIRTLSQRTTLYAVIRSTWVSQYDMLGNFLMGADNSHGFDVKSIYSDVVSICDIIIGARDSLYLIGVPSDNCQDSNQASLLAVASGAMVVRSLWRRDGVRSAAYDWIGKVTTEWELYWLQLSASVCIAIKETHTIE